MTQYFEYRPDHIPTSESIQDYYVQLKNLCDSGVDSWHGSKEGLKVINKAQQIWFKFLGKAFRVPTSVHNVEYALLKTLYHGYTQGHFCTEQAKCVLASLKYQANQREFSTTLSDVLSLIGENNRDEFSEEKRAQLVSHLTNFEEGHRPELSTLWESATKVTPDVMPDFGMGPIAQGERALANGRFEEAIGYAESAYKLAIRDQYENVEKLFLGIADRIKYPHPTVMKRLKDLLSSADSQRAAAIRAALKELDSSTPMPENEMGRYHLMKGKMAVGQKRYRNALEHFRIAIEHAPSPFQDQNFVHDYLTALKHENRLAEGINRLNNHIHHLMSNSAESTSLHNKPEERLTHLSTVRPQIEEAISLLHILKKHEPEQGAHPYRLGYLYEYLNHEYDHVDEAPNDHRTYYWDAVMLKPDNPYYVESAWHHYHSSNSIPEGVINAWSHVRQTSRIGLLNAEAWYEHQRWVKK